MKRLGRRSAFFCMKNASVTIDEHYFLAYNINIQNNKNNNIKNNNNKENGGN